MVERDMTANERRERALVALQKANMALEEKYKLEKERKQESLANAPLDEDQL